MPTGPKKMQRTDKATRPAAPAPEADPLDGVSAIAGSWQSHKRDANSASLVAKQLNDKLKDLLTQHGVKDNDGNFWVNDLEYVGYDSDGKRIVYNALERQRRRQTFMDPAVAEETLVRKDLLRQCATPVLVVTDTSALLAELIDAIFTNKDTWALLPVVR